MQCRCLEPFSSFELFDEKESAVDLDNACVMEKIGDVNIVCVILILTFQMETWDLAALKKETSREAIFSKSFASHKEEWLQKTNTSLRNTEHFTTV